jgi:hypothetical protein
MANTIKTSSNKLSCGNSLVASKPLAYKNVCTIFILFKQGKDLIFSLLRRT